MSRRFRFALVAAALAVAGIVLGLVLLLDNEPKPRASAKAAPPCTADGFSARVFAGCLRENFNAQQVARGRDERMVRSRCTDVTAELARSTGEPLEEGYRYFGCRIVFNEDGGAEAVVAWHDADTFAEAVTIERIKWDDDRAPGVGLGGSSPGG